MEEQYFPSIYMIRSLLDCFELANTSFQSREKCKLKGTAPYHRHTVYLSSSFFLFFPFFWKVQVPWHLRESQTQQTGMKIEQE